jgi:antitoxin FitA
MPSSITVRGVPDEVKKELAARVARSARSLGAYLRMHLIELASRPDPDALIDRIEERKRATRSSMTSEEILAYRDAGRR